MTEERREQSYERGKAEQYASLGRYVHEFEQVVQYLRMTCQRLVDGGTKEKSLVAVVFHHKSMTASLMA